MRIVFDAAVDGPFYRSASFRPIERGAAADTGLAVRSDNNVRRGPRIIPVAAIGALAGVAQIIRAYIWRGFH